MTLKPFKFIVQAVLLDTNEDKVVGEQVASPQTLYGSTLGEVAAAFDASLVEILDGSKTT